MVKRNELIGFVMDFCSYLLSKTNAVDRIILHGSIARDDYDEQSDIDLFIDTSEIKLERLVNKILEGYYKTKKFKEWELKGIDNEISVIVGRLDSDEWKDLKRSVMNTGIILYGKYKANIEKINQYTLFSFENMKPDKKRIAVFRKLYGFKVGNKKYSGMIEKINAVRIGKGSVLVPVEQVNELKRFFQERKVSVKLYDFWSDVKFEK